MGRRRITTPAWQHADELAEQLGAELSALQRAANEYGAKTGRKHPASLRVLADEIHASKAVVSDILRGAAPGILQKDLVVGIARHCLGVRRVEPDDGVWSARVQAVRQAADWARNGHEHPYAQSPEGRPTASASVVPATGDLLAPHPDPVVPDRFRDWIEDPDVVIVAETEWETPHTTTRPTGDGNGWQQPEVQPDPTPTPTPTPAPPTPRRRPVWWRWIVFTTGRVLAVSAGAVIIVVGAFVLNPAPSDHPSDDETSAAGPTESGVPPKPSATPPTPSPTPTPKHSTPTRTSTSTPPRKTTPSSKTPPKAPPVPLGSDGPATWLVSAQSGKCADTGLEPHDDTTLYQWVCADGVVNQMWTLREAQHGVYQLKNQHSGRCLAMDQGTDRLKVVSLPCSSTSSQQRWVFTVSAYKESWTYGYLRNKRWGQCLDVTGASMNDGAEIGPWQCVKDKLNQMFRMHPEAL